MIVDSCNLHCFSQIIQFLIVANSQHAKQVPQVSFHFAGLNTFVWWDFISTLCGVIQTSTSIRRHVSVWKSYSIESIETCLVFCFVKLYRCSFVNRSLLALIRLRICACQLPYWHTALINIKSTLIHRNVVSSMLIQCCEVVCPAVRISHMQKDKFLWWRGFLFQPTMRSWRQRSRHSLRTSARFVTPQKTPITEGDPELWLTIYFTTG